MNLRGDEHAVAENLVLNLAEADKLSRPEKRECSGVVAVDEREEALVWREAGIGSGRALEKRLGAGFQLAPQALDLSGLSRTESEVRADAGHFHEQGHRARIIGRTGGRLQRGGGGEGETENREQGFFEHGMLEAFRDDLFKLNDISGKFPDAFGELVGGHGVFVEHPAEGFFIHLNFLHAVGGGCGGVELAGHGV